MYEIDLTRNVKKKTLWQKIVADKLSGPLAWLFLLSVAVFVSYVVYRFGIMGGAGIVALVVGIPMLYGIIAYPKFGIVVLFIWAHLLNFVSNFTGKAPIGTSMDALEYLLILGFFLKQKYNRNWKIYADPISYLILAWIALNFMEVVNPVAASILAWVYTVRTVAVLMLMYFIFIYQINDLKFIKLLIKIWLWFSVIGAIYGYAQEINGYFPYEWAVLRKNPLTMHLNFQMGHWRKFSIFSDPVVYAYNMGLGTVMCIALLFGPHAAWKKWLMSLMIPLFMSAMLFSGTRAGYVMVPACLILLVVLYFNQKVMIASIIGAIMFAVLVFMPTSNGTLLRFQSAFKPSADASFNERAKNQAFIQPYIHAHPIGAGLGAVGIWGQRFAPNSPLSKFPPDSTYVRVAVELGFIGLFLFCFLIYTALRIGINNFFRIRDPELKNYCLVMILVLFAFNIGSYPQQSIVQFPANIMFYLVIALINVLKRLDDEKQLSLNSANNTPLKTV
ncbi:MAG: O-antigen ligase family protein [Bacteroidota bacterium]